MSIATPPVAPSQSDPITTQQQLEADFRPPAVRIGLIVYWYAGAQLNEHPVPAMVTGMSPQTVGLTIFLPFGVLDDRTGVRHLHDPFLRARAEVAGRDGAWTLVPEPRDEPDQEQVKALTMLHGGLGAKDIAEKMGGDETGWTHQRVNGVLRKFPDWKA